MISEKDILRKKIENLRSLPITKDTFSVYEAYHDMIDPHNPDDVSFLLFHEGEYFFRTGNFDRALSSLTRCLQAPKSQELKYLDAFSYNILGLINCYLGSETIACNHLLQCRTISEELHLEREIIMSYINQGVVYVQLEDYDGALRCYDAALAALTADSADYPDMMMRCQLYRGILFCKMGDAKNALSLFETLSMEYTEGEDASLDICMLDFKIHLYDDRKDASLLKDTMHKLLELLSPDSDFLPYCKFYLEICSFLIEHELQQEAAQLLAYVEPFFQNSPLIFLKRDYLQLKAAYAKRYDALLYPDICSQIIKLQPACQEEQRLAKLYNLEFVERLCKTKNDSEMFRRKSQLDQMTGLLNKYTIQFLIEEELAKNSARQPSAFLLIDLDHFKQINDTLGHMMGDVFICRTASVIQNFFQDAALCGRVGGDEFLVFINQAADRAFIQLQAEILLQEIYRQTSDNNITVTTQASIGIAFSSNDRNTYERLFAAADQALYEAKTNGRNKIIVTE